MPDTATFGGGCFWCLDAVFRRLQGVREVVAGYAGGVVPQPTYEEVCSGTSGHAEVAQITFDPDVVSYRELLEVFFATHDPTTRDRQGADVGPQYRSIVLYHTPEQRETAEQVIGELTAGGVFGAPIVTQVVPLDVFYPAEGYHQNYYDRNRWQPYCMAVINPKVAKLRQKFAHKLAPGA